MYVNLFTMGDLHLWISIKSESFDDLFQAKKRFVPLCGTLHLKLVRGGSEIQNNKKLPPYAGSWFVTIDYPYLLFATESCINCLWSRNWCVYFFFESFFFCMLKVASIFPYKKIGFCLPVFVNAVKIIFLYKKGPTKMV